MHKQTLEALGLRTNADIPATEIFAAAFNAADYGLTEKEASFIHCLKDFVQEYNREIPMEEGRTITTSSEAADLLYDTLRGLDHEEVWAVMLNRANRPVSRRMICLGSLDASIIDHRKVIKFALEQNATGVILFHNHPSGEPRPSLADVKETEKLQKALNVFDMKLIDHIVISDSKYYSFAEEKTLKIHRN